MSLSDPTQQEIVEEFELLSDWTDRYQYIIDLGRKLPEFPVEQKTEANRLHGCQSQVWVVAETHDNSVHIEAISDSAIVSGLIALMLRVYNDRDAGTIVSTPPQFIDAIGLTNHLSPTRSNGLNALFQKIQSIARLTLAKQAS